MSINDAREQRRYFLGLCAEAQRNPTAFVLCANPVWGSSETTNAIAIFDTFEALKAYVQASLLPEPVRTTDGIYRSFRPDSLLYDYNPELFDNEHGSRSIAEIKTAMVPWIEYTAHENPVPPVGQVPEMRMLAHPRYGVDYDKGYGPPRQVESIEVIDGVIVIATTKDNYTNMDGEVPQTSPSIPTSIPEQKP